MSGFIGCLPSIICIWYWYEQQTVTLLLNRMWMMRRVNTTIMWDIFLCHFQYVNTSVCRIILVYYVHIDDVNHFISYLPSILCIGYIYTQTTVTLLLNRTWVMLRVHIVIISVLYSPQRLMCKELLLWRLIVMTPSLCCSESLYRSFIFDSVYWLRLNLIKNDT